MRFGEVCEGYGIICIYISHKYANKVDVSMYDDQWCRQTFQPWGALGGAHYLIRGTQCLFVNAQATPCDITDDDGMLGGLNFSMGGIKCTRG